jgi:glycosyltransferase involved in cell wall biosynthesis
MAPQDRFLVLLRNERLADSIAPSPNLTIDLLPEVGLAGRMHFTYVDAPRRAAAWNADLYFSAGESAPLRSPCPTIASMRNPNVFTALDQGWPLKQRLRLRALRALARLSVRSSQRIMFVSDDSARWIGDTLAVPEERRAVIHHGIDQSSWKSEEQSFLHPWSYILSVSSVYRYKNFVRLIEAYGLLARTRPDLPDLVIIGDDQDPEYARKMEAARRATGPEAERIHVLGEVPYAEIPAWYAGAELFVFPSYLETFGHPLLEAMAAEVPVVAADIPVFREIAGEAALYADPHDPQAIARAIEDGLYRLQARDLLVKRGLERVREFSWDRSAERLLGLFEELLEERVRRVATWAHRDVAALRAA